MPTLVIRCFQRSRTMPCTGIGKTQRVWVRAWAGRSYQHSACNVYSMTKSFFLFRCDVYVIPLPFHQVLHFLMCIASMWTNSRIFSVLRSEAQFTQVLTKETVLVETPRQLPINQAVVVISAAVVTACCVPEKNVWWICITPFCGSEFYRGYIQNHYILFYGITCILH